MLLAEQQLNGNDTQRNFQNSILLSFFSICTTNNLVYLGYELICNSLSVQPYALNPLNPSSRPYKLPQLLCSYILLWFLRNLILYIFVSSLYLYTYMLLTYRSMYKSNNVCVVTISYCLYVPWYGGFPQFCELAFV